MKTLPTALRLALPILVTLAACTAPRREPTMTAYTDPAYVGRTFGRILVTSDVADLEWRTSIESALVHELRERGIAAESALVLLPPTRVWSDEQRRQQMSRAGIDAVLEVATSRTWTTETLVPQKTETTVTRTSSEKERKDTTGRREERGREEETITTTTSGGYTYTTEWGRYELRLREASSGGTAWIGVATMKTHGDLDDVRDDVVDQLQFDRMIAATDG